MKITRHHTVVVTYAIISGETGTFGGGPNGGSAFDVAFAIDKGIQNALDRLGGQYMTNTVELQQVSSVPLEIKDGAVFLAVTVVARLEPNKMKDMRFVK
jgi:hypothetical protein